jgi:hypothetical protein
MYAPRRLFVRVVRHARSLHRRVAWRATGLGARRRAFTLHCNRLLREYGSGGPLALYVIAMALVTIVTVLLATETMHEEI